MSGAAVSGTDGRVTVDPKTLEPRRADGGSLGAGGLKKRKIQTEAIACDTHCSLCQQMGIKRGVRIWVGARKLRPTQTYYIICRGCAYAIGDVL
jgi:hypothetical protein